MKLLVAWGNPLRRDDGAALELAQRLEEHYPAHELRIERSHQLTPELAVLVATPGTEAIIFADAALDTATPRLEPLAAASASPGSFSHHMSPQEILSLACQLGAAPPPAWLARIPAFDMGMGEGLSAECQSALEDMIRLFRESF